MSTTAPPVVLPLDLAPRLTERVVDLLAEVTLTTAPEIVIDLDTRHAPRCVVCRRTGKLGGHHDRDGRIQWVHAKCHRRLHRSGRHHVLAPPPRRRRRAC